MRKSSKHLTAFVLACAMMTQAAPIAPALAADAEGYTPVVTTDKQYTGYENGNAALDLTQIGRYNSGVMNPDGGSAEIVVYNNVNDCAYVINGVKGTLDCVSLSGLASTNSVQDLSATESDVKNLVSGFTYGDMTSDVTNRSLLVYGNNKVAAMGIVMKVNMIAALILVGFAFGCQPLVGYNYGARNKKRLKEILAFCYKFECGLAVILAVILSAGARPLIRVFMKTPEIVDSGVLMLRLQQAGMMFMAVVLVTTCVFQSAGKAMGAFLLSVSRQGVIYGIVIVIASHMIGYHGVLAAQAVSDFLTALMAAILLKHELWSELTDIKRNEEAV